MNNLQRASVIFVAGFLLCILFVNSSMAQSPSKFAESIKTQILLRSMTARGNQDSDNQLKKESQKKSSDQGVLDTLALGPSTNAFYSSANTMLQVARENNVDLVENLVEKVNKVIRKTLKNSPNAKWVSDKIGGKVFEVAVTGPQVLASAVEGDIESVAEGLLNSAGSGYSAAAGGKAGAALGSIIAPGPGTVIGGFLGAFAGAFAYNEVVAPEVTKAGDYTSNKIADGETKINNERLRIDREIEKNLNTVYPNGYDESKLTPDTLLGGYIELRPSVLYQNAEKIRQADKKFTNKLDQEIQKVTKKNDWQLTPDKTKPEEQTAFKAKKPVPDVKNKSLKRAFNILKNAGFILGSPKGGDPAPSKKLVGHVQMTLPAGGQPHYQDEPVVLVLYSDIEIPDVVGMTADKALKKLRTAGFSMAPEGCDPPPKEELSLLAKEQKPEAYTPGKGYDTVTVIFYPEYQKPVTPAITTLKLSEARDVLEEMGLSLNPDPEWGDQAETREQVGKIQIQQPAEGEPIEPGGEVKAWVYYTVVPKVLTMSKDNAESAMKAAWFVPNSEKGEAVKNKDKWGTIYSQALQYDEKFAKPDIKVTLKFYKKPEKKKKSSAHPLVGAWKVNTIEHSRANLPMKKDRKNNRYIKIQSVDHNGNFKGFYMNSGEDRKYKLLGTLNGNKIFLHCTLPRATYVYKYNGILNTQQMTIKGRWSYQCLRCNDSSWQLNVGPFYMKKK